MRQLGVIGLVLGWLLAAPPASAWGQGAEERRALAVVQRLGGSVVRDDGSPGKPVVGVDLGGTRATDEDLLALKGLPALRSVNLAFTGVTDAGLGHLKAASRLEVLCLFCCPRVTDKGVGSLRGLAQLRHLDLSHTQVTASGLKALRGLAGLRWLGLRGVRLPEEAEQNLKKALPKLAIDRGNGNTAEKRARKHFGVAGPRPLTPAMIRSAILSSVPVGSTAEQVYSYLKQAGIGMNKLSSYYPADKAGVVVCRVEFDPGSGDLVHKHYGIFLRLDEQKRLKEVEVKEWLMGP